MTVPLQDWFIAFVDVPERDRGWYDWWTRKARFTHCFAFAYEPAMKGWLVIEWTTRGIRVEYLTGQELEDLVFLAKYFGEVLEYHKPRTLPAHPFPHIALSYCVAGCKHLLGLRSWAITPDQLFRALLKSGGRVAFTDTGNAVERVKHGRDHQQTEGSIA